MIIVSLDYLDSLQYFPLDCCQPLFHLIIMQGKNLDIVEGFSDKLLSLSAVSEETDVILFDS